MPVNRRSVVLGICCAPLFYKIANSASFSQIVTPEMFGGRAAQHFKKAIQTAAEQGHGYVFLGPGIYESPYQGNYFDNPEIMNIANVSIIGSGKPQYSSDYSTLIGGTIIKGSFFFAANGFHISNCGIDVGADYCRSTNSDTPLEGIIGIDRRNARISGWGAGDPTKFSCQIDNVSILCHRTGKPDDRSDVHALLLENYKGWIVSRVSSVMGGAGLVIKSSHGSMSNVHTRGHYKYSVLNKSESYSEACYNNYIDLNFNGGMNEKIKNLEKEHFDTNGFRLEAATADVKQVFAKNINGSGIINGIQYTANDNFSVVDCHVEGGNFSFVNGYFAFMDRRGTGSIKNCSAKSILGNKARYGFYFLPGTVDCDYTQCSANDVTFYSYLNSGENSHLTECSSVNPGAGHIRSNAGSLNIVGDFHSVGNSRLLTNAGGTIREINQ